MALRREPPTERARFVRDVSDFLGQYRSMRVTQYPRQAEFRRHS